MENEITNGIDALIKQLSPIDVDHDPIDMDQLIEDLEKENSKSKKIEDDEDKFYEESETQKEKDQFLKSEIPQDLIDELRDLCKRDLFFFLKFVLGFKDLVYRVHGPICLLLQNSEYKRILIRLPRGWFKTTVVSIGYPIWRAINDLTITMLIVQNTFENACAKLSSIKSKIESNTLLRILFPELIPNKNCIWKHNSLHIPSTSTSPEGTFEAAGVKTTLTSRHYKEIIEDDTVAPSEDKFGIETLAPSKEDIAKAIGWHRLHIGPLFVDPSKDRSIVVGTRWYEEDLHSYIEEKQKYYVVYSRASRETDGKPDFRGELTFPERFTDQVLKELEISMGFYMFSCLYMNLPIASKDKVFKSEKLRFYDSLPENSEYEIFATIDVASDYQQVKSKDPDKNVIMICAKNLDKGHCYVLDYWAQKASPGEVIDQLLFMWEMYRFCQLGVENVAYQNTFSYWLNEKRIASDINFDFVVVPITGLRVSKEVRIRALQPLIESGKLQFRKSHTELLQEMDSFPLGNHDDIVDALSMQMKLWFPTNRNYSYSQKLQDKKDSFTAAGAIQAIYNRFKVDKSSLSNLLEGNDHASLVERKEEHDQEVKDLGVDHLVSNLFKERDERRKEFRFGTNLLGDLL